MTFLNYIVKFYVVLILLYSGCGLFAQERYNKIIDLQHQRHNILVNIAPVDNECLLIVGTNNDNGYGDKRCSLIAKVNNEGNLLCKRFVYDSVADVYEGKCSTNPVYVTENNTYKCIFEIVGEQMLLYEFDDGLEIVNENRISFQERWQSILGSLFSSNELYVFGQYYDSAYCGYIQKYDSIQNPVICYTVELNSDDESGLSGIKRTNNNGLIVVGCTSNPNINIKYMLLQKLDSSLNLIWSRTYGRMEWNNGIENYVSLSPDSCYVVSGHYPVCASHHSIHGAEEYASCVRKIDDNGNLLWEKIIKNYNYEPGIFSNEQYWDVYVDDEGYIYYVGNGFNFDGYAGFLTKLSPNGDIMYRRSYTPTGNHNDYLAKLTCIKPTADGGLIMGGTTSDSYYGQFFNGYYQQPWLIKTDKDGLDGLCYTELPELDFDVFIPDTVCNLDTINCVVNISGPSAPYTLEFSTGQVIDSIYYPDVFVLKSTGIDVLLASSGMYDYTEYITEATLKDTSENIIARHYNIATPTLPGEQQLAITLTDFYGNTKTIYKDLYVNPCHEVEVDENENVVLSVYPNPATEYINIAGENIAGIEICNLLGGVVYEMQQCNGNNVISTDGMGAGSYFVRVTMNDGKVVTKKIMVL